MWTIFKAKATKLHTQKANEISRTTPRCVRSLIHNDATYLLMVTVPRPTVFEDSRSMSQKMEKDDFRWFSEYSHESMERGPVSVPPTLRLGGRQFNCGAHNPPSAEPTCQHVNSQTYSRPILLPPRLTFKFILRTPQILAPRGT